MAVVWSWSRLEGGGYELQLLDDVDALWAVRLALPASDAFAGSSMSLGVQVIVHL